MQLKAQNPTLGNEATGTEQAALERLDAGVGLTGCFLNPCQEQDTVQPMLPSSTFVIYGAFCNLQKAEIGQMWETG